MTSNPNLENLLNPLNETGVVDDLIMQMEDTPLQTALTIEYNIESIPKEMRPVIYAMQANALFSYKEQLSEEVFNYYNTLYSQRISDLTQEI